MNYAYIFVSHTGANFCVVADAGLPLPEVISRASTVNETEFGAGTNDKFHGPTTILPASCITKE